MKEICIDQQNMNKHHNLHNKHRMHVNTMHHHHTRHSSGGRCKTVTQKIGNTVTTFTECS